VNSSASAQALIELTGLPASAMPVVHNGIDASVFTQLDAGDLPALRRRLGLPETAWLAGLFGRLAPWKGQHIAIDALPELPYVHLVLVGGALFGEDAYEAQLREQAQRLGVAKIQAAAEGGNVRFAERSKVDPLKLIKLIEGDKARYRLDGPYKLKFSWKLAAAEQRVQALEKLLGRLAPTEDAVAAA